MGLYLQLQHLLDCLPPTTSRLAHQGLDGTRLSLTLSPPAPLVTDWLATVSGQELKELVSTKRDRCMK